MSASLTGPTAAAPVAPGARSSTGAIVGLALAMFLASIGTSIANVALPTLAEAFGAPFQQVQWVVLAYLLAATALVVGAGRLGDLVGRRRLLVGALVLFAAASALCGLAPSLWLLLAGRAAQGLGAAAMTALAMSAVGEAAPRERTGRAMGLLGTMSAAGTALGPSLGGLLIAAFGWRSIFLLTVPLGLIAAGLLWRLLPPDRGADPEQGRFDRVGTILLALALAAYALAMTLGGGRFGPVNLALLAAAAATGAAFVRVQRSVPSPLVRPALLREPRLRASLAANALVATVMMATLVVGPFYLAGALGLGAAAVGLAMSAGPLAAALAGVPAGRLVDRVGAERTMRSALAGIAAGCAAVALLPAGFGVAGYVVPPVLVTACYALFQAANNSAVMSGSSPARRGLVSGLLNLSRNLGLITGASAMGAVFAAASAAAAGSAGPGAPEAVAIGMRATFGLAAFLGAAALAVAASRRPAGD